MAFVPTDTIEQNEIQSEARLTALEAIARKGIVATPAWTTVTAAEGSVVSHLTIPGNAVPTISNSQGRYVIGGYAGAWEVRRGPRAVLQGSDVVKITAGGRELRLPIAVLSKPRLGTGPGFGAQVTSPATANNASGGCVRVSAVIELRSFGGSICGKWSSGAPNNAFAEYYSYILIMDAAGVLNIITVTTVGGFVDKKASVSLSTIPGFAFNRPIGVRALMNGTDGTVDGVPANTARFYYSLNEGVTWVPLGVDVGGVSTHSISPAPSSVFFVGSMASPDNFINGAVHKAEVAVADGRILFNPDFTTRTTGSTGPLIDTAGTPNTWAVNGPICVDTHVRASTAIAPKLTRTSTFKVKGMELTPLLYATGNNGWGPSLGRYDSANFEARIARAKQLGCNVTKFASTGDPVYDNYPSVEQQEIALSDYFRLLQKYDMLHYHNIAHSAEVANPDGSGVAAKVASLVSHMKLLMKYGADRIIGVDLVNESYFGGVPRTWGGNSDVLGQGSIPSGSRPNAQMQADIAYLAQEMRKAAPEIPFSLSTYLDGPHGANMQTDGLLMFQAALGLDFHDYHAYNGLNNNTSISPDGVPGAGQLANLTSQPWYLGRMLNGECGIRTENSDAAKTAWVNGMAAQGQVTTSFGGIYFGDENYQSTSEVGRYGMFNDASPALRNAMAAWPNP